MCLKCRAKDEKAKVLFLLVRQGLQSARDYTDLDVCHVHKTCLSIALSHPGQPSTLPNAQSPSVFPQAISATLILLLLLHQGFKGQQYHLQAYMWNEAFASQYVIRSRD